MKPPAWIWILAACILHVAVWAGWFVLAAAHPVADVPLRSHSPDTLRTPP